MGCNGNCSSCSGCARELVLTEKEIEVLNLLGQYAFLPVARTMGDLTPVYPEQPEEDFSLLLQCLEKKGLLSLDYHLPLKGYSHPEYDRLPIRGSMALTQRGQLVLELIEFQGVVRN